MTWKSHCGIHKKYVYLELCSYYHVMAPIGGYLKFQPKRRLVLQLSTWCTKPLNLKIIEYQ